MTDRYCVIGNPVAHSRSPGIHAAFAAQFGIDMAYTRCEAPLDGFEATLRSLVAQHYRGANVTLPFKLEAARLCNSLSERAHAAGAANTLSFEDGRIIGDNTDGAGLVADIVRNAGVPLAGARVLLVGAGGAARGVLLPLQQQGPRELVVANRTESTAAQLVARLAGSAAPGQLRHARFAQLDGPFDIVINATSASLSSELPPLPAAVFAPHTLALDMMYAQEPTVFMRFASAHGAQARDGLGMLVEQAAESFWQWRGRRPDTAPVLARLRAQP